MTTPTHTYTLLIDGHVHLYPSYDWALAINSLLHNLSATAPAEGTGTDRIKIGLLAESRFCHFYRDVIQQGSPLKRGDLELHAGPDEGALTIRKNGLTQGYLIAGRQIVTREKLELLAIGRDVAIADGLPAAETLEAIHGQGAIPVLSWSPGKWFFGRGKIVANLIEGNPPGRFLLGDTGLRPTLWRFPHLMKRAQQRGYRIMGGSDPLPLPGEESWLGTYGFHVTTSFDPSRPAASLRRILQDGSTDIAPMGHRNGTLPFISRWIRNQTREKAPIG